MSARTTVEVNPDNLKWARIRAGFELQEAARAVRMSPDKLEALERGETFPSPANLRMFSTKYNVPVVVFVFSETPEESFEAPASFRRLPEADLHSYSPRLRRVVDRVRAQIRYLRELSIPPSFTVPSGLDGIDTSSNPEIVGGRIRDWLLPDDVGTDRIRRVPLSDWISYVEARGIFVAQDGALTLLEMRGFCLVEPDYPFVILNQKDTPNGRKFSLLHEVVHVLLGESVVSESYDSHNRTEVFCNAIAASVLIPKEMLRTNDSIVDKSGDLEWKVHEIDALANDFGVSAEAMLRRLKGLGWVDGSSYSNILDEVRSRYSRRLDRASDSKPIISPRVKIPARLGKRYTSAILGAYDSGRLSRYEASSRIFAKTRWVDEIDRKWEEGSPR